MVEFIIGACVGVALSVMGMLAFLAVAAADDSYEQAGDCE
jgi:hypothetical protein